MARIVINPTTFKNKKDAMCVAFNEAFRIIMEMSGFEPQSEPTEAQRKFFSDTEYADDEVQLRRTILARICTLDTSVKDPTDEQLQECLEFLDSVTKGGFCKNQWEQWAVRRIYDIVSKVTPKQGDNVARPHGSPANADGGGGATDEEKKEPVGAEPPPPQDKPDTSDVSPESKELIAKVDASAEKMDAAIDAYKAENKPEEVAKPEAAAAEPKPGEQQAAEPKPGEQQAAGPKPGEQQAVPPAQQKPEEKPTEQPRPGSIEANNAKSMNGGTGIDRSQFGQNGRIGIGARIVDPKTGKSISSLSAMAGQGGRIGVAPRGADGRSSLALNPAPAKAVGADGKPKNGDVGPEVKAEDPIRKRRLA